MVDTDQASALSDEVAAVDLDLGHLDEDLGIVDAFVEVGAVHSVPFAEVASSWVASVVAAAAAVGN